MKDVPSAAPEPEAARPDLVVDQRGRRCPMPVIELARRISDVPVGGVVQILTDDPAAVTDVPAWCRMRGQDLIGVAPDGPLASGMVFRVRRAM